MCHGNYLVGGGDGGDGHGVMLESEHVGEAFAASAFHDGMNTAVVLEGRPYVPAVGGVVGPGFDHDGLRWTRTSVPGGAMGVALKENNPSIALNVDRRRF